MTRHREPSPAASAASARPAREAVALEGRWAPEEKRGADLRPAPARVTPPPGEALIAVGIGAAAALWSGAVGLFGFAIILLSLGLAHARFSGRSFARTLDRPRLFSVIAALYLPIFLADVILSARINPVTALVRLVIFLVVAVSACGTSGTGHRMLLLGLLLLVAAAGETTDIWIAIPLLAFMIAAVCAQMRESLDGTPADRDGSRAGGKGRMRWLPAAALVAGAILIGGMLFLAIPRFGAGWGQRLAAAGLQRGLDAGLSDSVNLGAVGRVKLERKIAFTARLRGAPVNPDTIYWRGGSYARWTGRGWSMDIGDPPSSDGPGDGADREAGEAGGEFRETVRSERVIRSLSLPAGGAVALTPLASSEKARTELAAEIDTREDKSGMLFAPGYALWIKTPWNARVLLAPDGALRGPTGIAPRHYEVGASASSMGMSPLEGAYLDVDRTELEVIRWARSVAPKETTARLLARALAADLSRRSYSLDTRSIDPTRPLASFLAGAPAHCEYFASAMAIGLRARGVPARVVGGFLGADASTFGDDLVVRESRAHMWVEAYLPDEGWTRFDPTPEAGRVPSIQWKTRLTDAWQSLVRGWDALVIGLDLGDQASLVVWFEQTWDGAMRWAEEGWGPVISGLGVLGIPLAFVLLRRRRTRARPLSRASIPPYYRHLLLLAERRGVRPRSSETARELALRVVESFEPKDRSAIDLLSGLYEKERFGAHPPSASEIEAAARALDRLRRSRSRRAA